MLSWQESIGIELREDEMIIAHLRKRGERLRLKSYAVMKLGPPEQGEGLAADEKCAMAIRRFVAEHGITQASVVMGIPRKFVIFRFIDFPQVASENLDKAVKYELERHLPFPIPETYYDCQKVYEDGSNCRYLLVAAKKETVQRYLEVLRLAGLSPTAVDVTSFGTFNSYAHCGNSKSKGVTALLNLCGHEIELSVVDGKRLLYSRSVALKEGQAPADQIKRELEMSMMALKEDGGRSNIDRINLSGGDEFARKDLAVAIEFGCSCETSPADLPDGLSFKAKDSKPGDWPKLYTAIGLALRGFGNCQLNFNLLGAMERKRESANGTFATIILLIIALGIGSALLGSELYRKRYEINALNKEIEGMKPAVFVATDIQKEIESLQAQLNSFEKLKAVDPSKLNILKELTQILPQDAWIEKLIYQKDKIEITGYADSASALIPLLESSPLFENVEFISTITKKESKEQFRIKLDIEG